MIAKKRYWWVAFPLMILNGVGYLYVGRIGRFIFFWAFYTLFYFIFTTGLSGWLVYVGSFVAFYFILFCATIFFLIDAPLIAKSSENYSLQWYNKWWIYLITIIGLGLIQFVPDSNTHPPQSPYAVRLFSIPAVSMSPTLLVGDRIITDSRYYLKNEPKRGEIVVFAHPKRPQIFWVKRIVGLPGDKVQMINGILFINNKAIPRKRSGEFSTNGDTAHQIPIFTESVSETNSYQTLDLVQNSSGDNTKLFKVPAGKYFVMGDNRDNSSDSRYGLGFIPRENIIYKPTGIYWSRDWSRIGTSLN